MAVLKCPCSTFSNAIFKQMPRSHWFLSINSQYLQPYWLLQQTSEHTKLDTKPQRYIRSHHRHMSYFFKIAQKWKELFLSVCDKHAPVKTKRTHPTKSPWITTNLKKRMNFRNYNILQFCPNEKGLLNFVSERIIFLKLVYRINNTPYSFQKTKRPFKLLKPHFIGRVLSN